MEVRRFAEKVYNSRRYRSTQVERPVTVDDESDSEQEVELS
jgi:hypothetical protein